MHIEIRVHTKVNADRRKWMFDTLLTHWDLPIEGSSEDECLPFIEKAMMRISQACEASLIPRNGVKIAFVTPYLIESEEFLADDYDYDADDLPDSYFVSIRIKEGQLSPRSVQNLAQINS